MEYTVGFLELMLRAMILHFASASPESNYIKIDKMGVGRSEYFPNLKHWVGINLKRLTGSLIKIPNTRLITKLSFDIYTELLPAPHAHTLSSR